MSVKGKRLGALLCVVVLVATLGVAAAAGKKPLFESSAIVSLPGVGGPNSPWVDDGFVYVAPFFPSNGLAGESTAVDDGAGGVTQDDVAGLDNHFLYIISKDDPTGAQKRIDINSFYPTRVVRDESGQKIFVRATDFIRTAEGEWQPAEVVVCVDLNVKEGLSPSVVKVQLEAASDADPTDLRIPGSDLKWASSAPNAFVSGRGGRFGIYTNGRKLFCFSLSDGHLNTVELIDEADYSEANSISDLQFEPATNTLVAVVTGYNRSKKGLIRYFSDLHFFRLGEAGELEPLAVVRQSDMPVGASLTPGSDVVIRSQPDGSAQTATFVTDDGSVIRATVETNPLVKRLGVFPELATFDGPTNGNTRGPRFLRVGPNGKWLAAGAQGSVLQIRRPVWDRPGRNIRRPVWLSPVTEAPVFAIASISKSGGLTGGVAFTDFGPATSISNPVTDGDSSALFMTSSGTLFSAPVGEQTLDLVGKIESGVDSFGYFPAEKRVVGVRSVGMDQTGRITSEGALIIGRLDFDEGTAAVFAPGRFGLRIFGLIRRPCGIELFAR
jgi:hypothetical protein